MEDVPPPLPLDTPLLLVKPPMGLATPEIFKALDLSTCSKADPRQLLQQMTGAASMTQDMCVNDLERPAFDRCVYHRACQVTHLLIQILKWSISLAGA